jgi:hypothetical protein
MAAAEAARAAAQVLTFKAAAEALIETKRPGWRNAEHAWQWESTLQTLADPMLGDLDVQAIDTAAVAGVLTPIWTSRTETASRLRQRIEAMLDYAKALGRRSGENPARWKGRTSTTSWRHRARSSRWRTSRRSTGATGRSSWSSRRSAAAWARRPWPLPS